MHHLSLSGRSLALSLFLGSAGAMAQVPDVEVLAFTNAPLQGTGLRLLDVTGIRPGADGGWAGTGLIGITDGVTETAIYGDPSVDGSAGPRILRRPTTLGSYAQAGLGSPSLQGGRLGYLASRDLPMHNRFDSAWIDQQILAEAGDPIGMSGLTWASMRELQLGGGGQVFVRGQSLTGGVLVRVDIPSVLLAKGDTLPGLFGPVNRIERLAVSPDGQHWAARIVSDDQVHFRASIIVDGSALSTGGGLAIERRELGPAFDLPGARWTSFLGLGIANDGRVTFQATIVQPGGTSSTVTVRGNRIVDTGNSTRRFQGAAGSTLALFADGPELRIDGTAIVGAAASIDVDGDGHPDPGYALGMNAAGHPQWSATFTSGGIIGRCLVDFPNTPRDPIAIVRIANGVEGDNVCDGVPNSMGTASTLHAVGQSSRASNDVTLLCTDLPGSSMGYVIVSTESRSIITPGGSQGTLCLGGMIGRHRSEMFITAPDGLAEITLDLGQLPQPTGTVSGQVGETWYFQAWHRDVVAGAMTSNFSSALSLTLTP